MKSFLEFIKESNIPDKSEIIQTIKDVIGTNFKEYDHGDTQGFMPKNKVSVQKLLKELLKIKGLYGNNKVWGKEFYDGYIYWSLSASAGHGHSITVSIDSEDGKNIRNIAIHNSSDRS